MKYFVVLIFSLAVTQNSYALGLNTGSDVLSACKVAKTFLAGGSDDSRNAEACVHFLMGFDSGQSVASLTRDQSTLYCQPKSENIGGMINTVVAELETNSDYHSAPAGVAVWQALSSAWPCN